MTDEAKRYLALLKRTMRSCEDYQLRRCEEHQQEALAAMARQNESLKQAAKCSPQPTEEDRARWRQERSERSARRAAAKQQRLGLTVKQHREHERKERAELARLLAKYGGAELGSVK